MKIINLPLMTISDKNWFCCRCTPISSLF